MFEIQGNNQTLMFCIEYNINCMSMSILNYNNYKEQANKHTVISGNNMDIVRLIYSEQNYDTKQGKYCSSWPCGPHLPIIMAFIKVILAMSDNHMPPPYNFPSPLLCNITITQL